MSKESETGSHYVTVELAKRAVDLVAPMIEQARGRPEIVGSGFLYVVIMNPALTPLEASFEDAVLHEHAFGDRSRWDADYAGFARDKARLTWRTGYDGTALQHAYPHLLRKGDTLLTGAVSLDGLVVAASGAMAVYDDVFAGAIALSVRALARERRMGDHGRLSL